MSQVGWSILDNNDPLYQTENNRLLFIYHLPEVIVVMLSNQGKRLISSVYQHLAI